MVVGLLFVRQNLLQVLIWRTNMKNLFQATALGLIFLAASFAQEGSRFTFDLGFGFTNPVGNTGRNLNEGWNLAGGFGVNFRPWVGASIDLGYDSFGINGAT